MQQRNSIALNGTQKNIIEGTLNFYFAEIAQLEPKEAIKALTAITQIIIPEEDVANFKKLDVLSSINAIREILSHAYPQNRRQGDPNAYMHGFLRGRSPVTKEEREACQTGAYQGTVYYYSAGFGSNILTEPQGMLGLTSRNDKTAQSVTKEAVTLYIHQLINNELEAQEKKLPLEQQKIKSDAATPINDVEETQANKEGVTSMVRMLIPEYTSIVNSSLENAANEDTTTMHNVGNRGFMFDINQVLSRYRHHAEPWQLGNGAFTGIRDGFIHDIANMDMRSLSRRFYRNHGNETIPTNSSRLGFDCGTSAFTFFGGDINSENTRSMREAALALRALCDSSITVSYLQTHWIPPRGTGGTLETLFTCFHRDALIYLVTGRILEHIDLFRVTHFPPEKCLTVQAALAEIASLNSAQCISLVRSYHPYGLRGDHLRSWQPADGRPESGYSPAHGAALFSLITLNNLPPLEAVQQISRKTFDEAAAIDRSVQERAADDLIHGVSQLTRTNVS